MRRWALALLIACSGVEARSGLDEPLQVRGGSFKSGALPGGAERPEVTAIESASLVLRPGQTEKAVLGRTSTDAAAVAVRFADLGTGYWVIPVGGPDPSNGGELEWAVSLSFGPDVPPGPHELLVVAIDAAGNAGAQRGLPTCVASAIPDNDVACDPNAKLPAAVVSLTWDTPADLDLVVVAPDGTLLSAKRPRNGDPDAGAGTITRDSNAACLLDHVHREDLVFQVPPPAGSYLVYASLFDACGRAPVHFRVSVKQGPDVTLTREGTLLGVDANGGATLGTFVTELSFE
ncbi:MAG: hypothetical protein KIT84_30190 [Labilithrix sp.]|nr:hypothetical protein [Labilithrix sp.]MCW5815335.1 hypothetical protein [Labilithrix sp.]